MVTTMGFSKALGNVDLHNSYNNLSSETKQLIESEVRRIIDESRARATKLLTERRKELDMLAKALVEYEVLDLEEMKKVLKGEKLPKMSAAPNSPIKIPDLALPPGFGEAPIDQPSIEGDAGKSEPSGAGESRL